jgi:hypothetical protein
MKIRMTAAVAALVLAAGTSGASAQGMAPFGTDGDVAYAAQIWAEMNAQNLVGAHAVRSLPYEGSPPHGAMLETFYSQATIGDHTGAMIVKRNYGPADVDADTILADPAKHLGAITVMFKREAGFDADNQDWFWAKFLPDGSLDKNSKGMMLAGKVAKGAEKGCIACHSNAGGDDYIFTTDAPVGMAMMGN